MEGEQTGAMFTPCWPIQLQSLFAADDGDGAIDYTWGVIDAVPETNFPDIRNRCVIHSESGSCMVIPREGSKVRFYIQLSDKQVVDAGTGRVDKNRVSVENLLQVRILSCLIRLLQMRYVFNFDSQVVKRVFRPYTIDAREIEWWTVYVSTLPFTLHSEFFSNHWTQLVNESPRSFPFTSASLSLAMLVIRTLLRLDRV